MSLESQREMLNVLAEIWAMSPDVRLGQLMTHLGFLGESHLGRGLGYIDDDELMAVLYRHRDELAARLRAPGPSPFDLAASSVSGIASQSPPSLLSG